MKCIKYCVGDITKTDVQYHCKIWTMNITSEKITDSGIDGGENYALAVHQVAAQFQNEHQPEKFQVLIQINRLDQKRWEVSLPACPMTLFRADELIEALKVEDYEFDDSDIKPSWEVKLQGIPLKEICKRPPFRGYNIPSSPSTSPGTTFIQVDTGSVVKITLEEESPSKKRKTIPNYLFVFYDMETIQIKPYKNKPDSFIHEPICVISHKICPLCIHEEDTDYNCTHCKMYGGPREKIFINEGEFADYLMKLSESIQNVYAVAHNGGGYDAIFLLKHFIVNLDIIPTSILKVGSKVYKFEIITVINETHHTIHFLDSFNFLHMKLAKLPKTFGFENMKKGNFPYLLLNVQPERESRVDGTLVVDNNLAGPLPPIEAYNINYQLPEERQKFLVWYENKKITERPAFNFKFHEELISYCRNDVVILRKAMLKFCEIFTNESNVDPLTETVTLAVLCLLTFRRNFLQSDSVAVLPAGERYNADIRLHILQARKWLLWEENQRKCVIKVDQDRGYGVNKESRNLFFFHECFAHGCFSCFPKNRETNFKDGKDRLISMKHLLDDRKKFVSTECDKFKYTPVERWECEFKNEIKDNLELKVFVNHLEPDTPPLHPRDAFFGGRTEPMKLYYKCKDNERIHYLDVCSLYPWVMKYGKFPIGHPEIILENFEELDEFEGLISCEVLPPRKLLHPVLPYKTKKNVLVFPLCRTCAEEQYQVSCPHDNPKDRILQGTWVVDEVRKAEKLGYKVETITEVWKYQVDQYNPSTKQGVFVNYINHFLKSKTESSGWPIWAQTNADKDIFLQKFYNHEGIHLNRYNMQSNPGRREVAKLCLNTLWGKIGQRQDYSSHEIFNIKEEFISKVNHPKFEIKSVKHLSPISTLVECKKRIKEQAKNNNCVIAAYTAALARLKLYTYMEELQEKLLYCDTDSVIYVSTNEDGDLPIGDYLGDLTDEIAKEYGKGAYISEFVSGGPKNYGYKVKLPDGNEKTTCKLRGITQHYENISKVNFEVMKEMVMGKKPEKITWQVNRIMITPTFDVITTPSIPITYRILFTNKRRRIGQYDSLPFGHID